LVQSHEPKSGRTPSWRF